MVSDTTRFAATCDSTPWIAGVCTRFRTRHAWIAGWILLSAWLAPVNWTQALTVEELRADKNLTPERFIRYFADFKFELSGSIRAPDAFLQSRVGDCDDFATLAAELLREKGYTTRLIVVQMPKQVHVVCYVQDIHGYLDYNCRMKASPVVPCADALGSIAASVAESFRTQWRSVSEFKIQNGARTFMLTEFR